jgi:hypothetical protein
MPGNESDSIFRIEKQHKKKEKEEESPSPFLRQAQNRLFRRRGVLSSLFYGVDLLLF